MATKKRNTVDVMTPDHSRWAEFCDRLDGLEGCNFHDGPDGKLKWTCKGGEDKTFARRLLTRMGFSRQSIAASFAFFESNGGFCDCEILFNVEHHVKVLREEGADIEGKTTRH